MPSHFHIRFRKKCASGGPHKLAVPFRRNGTRSSYVEHVNASRNVVHGNYVAGLQCVRSALPGVS